MGSIKRLGASLCLSAALVGVAAPAYADNYVAKDGNGSIITLAAKLVSGILHPLHIFEGQVNGTGAPQPVSVDSSGNVNVNVVSGGGSGGGGAVTAVSGAYVAGSIVDLGTGSSPSANTVNANLKAIIASLGSPMQAGGAVSLTGSLPGFASTPTVNIGTIPSVAVTGVFYQATQPVSAASLPLPAGAATAAKQPALGTAGVASTDVITVQGIASGVAQPVSNAGTFAVQNTAALPTGGNTIGAISNTTFAATQATAANLNATVVGTGTLAVQNTAAVVGGNGVAVKTDGSATTQPISATALPLPALASTSTLQTSGGQKTQIVDGAGNVIASTSNNLNVQCANCSGSGVSTADNATFTAGSSLFVSSGGIYQSAATSNPLTAGRQGLGQFTQYRAAHVNLRDSSGNELGLVGTPLYVICSSGCTGGGGSGYSVLNASTYANTASYSNVPSGGLVATSAPTYTTGQASPISLTTAGAIRIDGTATTQPISGTVAATQSGIWTDTVTQATAANLNATVVGTGTFATQAAQSGTWTVQPGNTQNTTAWLTQDASNAAISAGAAPAKASIVGGVFNTTLPTLTTGQTAGLQVDSSGRAIVAQATASALNATVVQATAANLQTTATLAAGVAKIGATGVAQASTTSGLYGDLVQGAVTTAAPTYTTATTNPLSLNVAGGLRVDGSGVTQPVSVATLPALTTGSAVIGVVGNAQASTTSGQSGPLVQGAVTSAAPTYTTATSNPLSMTTAGALRTDATATTQPISASALPLPAGAATSAAQTTGNASLATLAGTVSGSAVNVSVLSGGGPAVAATTSTNGTTSGGFSSVLAYNATRKGCNITNTSTASMLVALGASPTTANAVPFPAGASFSCASPSVIVSDQINLYGPSGATWVVWAQ